MTLSIIIVNYNVKYFLEQCLYSVQKSSLKEFEIIVVDNQSSDGSISYLKPKFPQVRFIINEANLGFAKACNQGLGVASGQNILFLNPDTIVAEDTLETAVKFLNQNEKIGAIGVRMIDGKGNFLKESKRSFPGPVTSLFKLFGFARVFPRSRSFSRYHLGHLNEHDNHEVDVLAGAFMMIKKQVLQKCGTFDETFFMYGEDVDLSYRIQKAGYKNYYVADSEIIHFKGESTKRGSLNYVRMFYTAMSIFVQKHYGGARAGLFNASIHFAIWFRALLSAAAKFIKWVGLPIIDAILILLCFLFIKEVWTTYVRPKINYPDRLLWVALPCFTIVYLVVAYYAGLYNKKYRSKQLICSTTIATLVLLAAYSLLPEHFRFSRAIVLFGAVLAFVALTVVRWIMLKVGLLEQAQETNQQPYILIAGSKREVEEVKVLLQDNKRNIKVSGIIIIDAEKEQNLSQLENVYATAAAINRKELILCSGTLTNKKIIETIKKNNNKLRIRYHSAGSGSIVGSDSSGTSGEVFSSHTRFNLAEPHYKRLKRLIDILSSLFFLLSFPVHLMFVKNKIGFVKNCINVLLGKSTWIGYHSNNQGLPELRKEVLTATGFPSNLQSLPIENYQMMDYWYAKNYQPKQDIQTIYKNYKDLGG